LNSIETEEKEKLQGFKIEIENVRNKYMDEIQKLTETAKKSKEQIESKVYRLLCRYSRLSSRVKLQQARMQRSRESTNSSEARLVRVML